MLEDIDAARANGDPGRIRTCDLQLRRLLLYPLSYGAKETDLFRSSLYIESKPKTPGKIARRHERAPLRPRLSPAGVLVGAYGALRIVKHVRSPSGHDLDTIFASTC